MRDDGHDRQGTADAAGSSPPDRWLHGTWQVVRADGDALADGLQGPPWLTFDGDGVVFGYAGVNRVRGTWWLAGNALTFGPVVATLMAGPPEAARTERAVLGLLRDGGELERADDVVTLRTAEGRTAELVRTTPRG
ncbi:META domain-containing protein [Cellulomonas sp. KH9]|uniref:META domain-containing protein n=1 Tax=Cellulomonas sp. KH9 TaxID=1855324 RepID=UPI0008E77318|nr:META domain-containing protein [Cellulomonas sp. KH9]SFK55022.1 META domain-containing protein [Cellulomonas sp. KH9]